MIRFTNITKKYKDHIVLDNISLEIEKGELVVLIGPSGCGKTTTLKMINHLIRPSSGKIYINNEDILKKNVIELRRNIGYVIQQTGLFPHMTVRQNIEIIPKLEKRDPKDIENRTIEVMEMVGMDAEEYLDRYPTELSGGQQQRIGVARAFATDPDIILMDEPFSAVDPITRSSLQDELVILQEKLKRTIVFVTHDMDEAVKIADKVCIMHKGKILQYDTPENILKNPANDFVSEFVGKKRIWSSPEYIKAEDIMIETPITCYDTHSIFKCQEKLRSAKVDSLIVLDSKTKTFIGTVSAKQLINAEDKKASVVNVMNTDRIFVKPDDTIVDISNLINEGHKATIPVLDENGRLQGLITRSSLVTTLSQQYIDEEAL